MCYRQHTYNIFNLLRHVGPEHDVSRAFFTFDNSKMSFMDSRKHVKQLGMTSRVFLKSRPSKHVSPSLNVQYFLMSAGTCCISAGHPAWTISMTICNSSSAAVCVLNVFSFSSVIGSWAVSRCTCSSSSRSCSGFSFRWAQLSVSAM